MMVEPKVKQARVVMVGDSAVGKTSILNQLVDHTFNQFEQSTIGSNYQIFVEDIGDIKVEMQIWDTSGQEKFRSLGPIYYRNAIASVAVYDQTIPTSYQHLESWVREVIEVAGPSTIIAIAANKCDLTGKEQISFEEAKSWAKSRGFIIEQTSALNGTGIYKLFSRLAASIVNVNQEQELGKDINRKINTGQQKKCEC
ncbi:small GTP-binding protein [Histomonas meleagridis]|uniref:small GTP-binding protein n=1 Tax=Histomonas meleagridis TaxID=135588 RepID=UPI00355A215C|nr:small GTP-binding protein [Histomonas meleagridis]KAH0805723.1 small GTP-binding protein [Histomonas meleagridis]